MKSSVVLTTYNGMKFIEQLLDSLRTQTRSIDEVLICDDGSTDGTKEFVEEYIQAYKLNNWRTIWNEQNKGWKRNFKDGILEASGDVIFPCDQDDIWMNNKIERMMNIMMENNNIQLLSSNYSLLYEKGSNKIEDYSCTQQDVVKIQFDKKFAIGGIRPGCVMAIRKSLTKLVSEIWLDWYPHDSFLWTCSVLLDGCYVLNEELIVYRRHSDNASAHMNRHAKAHLEAMRRSCNIIEWYFAQPFFDSKKEMILRQYQQFAALRIRLFEKKEILLWLRLIQYYDFYRSIRQEIGDLYLLIKDL